MNRQELMAILVSTLQSVAPEVDEKALVANRPLRNQVDLDSMDWLNFLIGLHEQLKVDIPESDYAKLLTLDNLVDYLEPKVT